MWQFQWMMSLIPDAILNWIYWAIIAVGLTGMVASWIGKFIPFYGKYVRILKPVGIALVILGVWLRGGYDVEMAWKAKTADLESKVAVSEKQSKDANNQLQDALKGKTKVIHDVQVVVKEHIVHDTSAIDAECKLAPEAIKDLNDAAGVIK